MRGVELKPLSAFESTTVDNVLMLRDVEVLKFNLDTYDFCVLRPELLPFYLRGRLTNGESNPKKIISSFDLIRSFFSQRVLSLSRDNAKLLYALFKIQQSNRIDDRVQACLAYRAVSVGDSYWVRKCDEFVKWKDINVRKNSLSSIIEISLEGRFPTLTTNSQHPDLTTDGLFRKSWIRRGDDLFLIKSDRTSDFVHTKMEVLASKILDCFDGVEHVAYKGAIRQSSLGDIFICICKNYCSEELSTVHASDVIAYCNTLGIDFKQWALATFGYKFANIPVLDYVLLNTDRHTANYGFYFDNGTGEIVDVLPLYDHNLALIADLAGTSKEASETLSQMFNDESTIKQLAFEMKPYSNLKFNQEKFNQLKKDEKEYENVLNGVFYRLNEVLV